jgi:hypothetical protein
LWCPNWIRLNHVLSKLDNNFKFRLRHHEFSQNSFRLRKEQIKAIHAGKIQRSLFLTKPWKLQIGHLIKQADLVMNTPGIGFAIEKSVSGFITLQ